MVRKTKRNKSNILLALCLSTALGSFSLIRAEAAPAGMDIFSATAGKGSKPQSINPAHPANSKVGANASPLISASTSVTSWFENFDQLRDKYRPTAADRVIIERPLMQEEERVKQWTATANKISKNYMLLASALQKMTIPNGAKDLKEYRDLSADWYRDAAMVYDDLIRPREAAKTIEELKRQLDEVQSRSNSLGSTIANLNAMDAELRKQYKVHASSQDDALQQFINPTKQ